MVGAPATLVFLAATSPQQALQFQPIKRLVVRNGKLVSSRQENLIIV